MKRFLLLVLLSCIGLAGCVHKPIGPLPREHLHALGKIGLVYAQYAPAVEFEAPTKGGVRGAAKGAAYGSGTGILLVPAFAIAGSSGGGPGMVLGAAMGALLGAGYIIGGPIYGAVKAEPAEVVEEAHTQLQKALAGMQIQKTVSDHVFEAAQSHPHVLLTTIHGEGPETPSDVLTYLPLSTPGIATVLEVRVTKVALVAKVIEDSSFTGIFKLGKFWPINRPLSLRMQLRARLIRLQDRSVAYQNGWTYEGEPRTFAEWSKDEAKAFGEEFERAYAWLAGQLVSYVFLGPPGPVIEPVIEPGIEHLEETY